MAVCDISAEALRLIDTWSSEIVDFARQLVATPSVNPPGDERAVAQLISTRLTEIGCGAPATVAKDACRPNLIHLIHCSSPGPVLGYCGHMDTKPIGKRAEWCSDPFEAGLRDGKVYGLGSTDMKGALAAMIYAARAVQSFADQLQGGLELVFTADEEAGGVFGARFLSDARALRADVMLVAEPSGITSDWQYLCLVSRGESCFRVRVHGTQMHSSISDVVPSVNANLRLADVLLKMSRELEIHYQPHPSCPTGITVTPSVMMKGGEFYGILPGVAESRAEIRTIPGMTRSGIRSDVEAFIERLRKQDPDLEIEFMFEEPPFDWIAPVEFPSGHPFVAALDAAANAVLGYTPPKGSFPAWTDARFFSDIAGIPTIPAFGPGMLTVTHSPNESQSANAIIQAAKIYALAALGYLQI